MNATILKYIAAAAMLLDHAAVILLPVGLPHLLLRTLGRVSFPIFAWFVAESCRKTHDQRRFLLRLLLFALISQGPFWLAFSGSSARCSVLLTYFLSVASILAFQRLWPAYPLPTALLPLLAAAIAGQATACDYEALGVILPAGLYLFGEDRRGRLAFVGSWCAVVYLLWTPFTDLLTYLPAGALTPGLWGIVGAFLLRVYPLYLFYALGAFAALPLLARYSGELGAGNKWFFYWFYPLHLLLLWLLARFVL